MYSKIVETIEGLDVNSIPGERQLILEDFINLIRGFKENKREIKLNFICTHNSRRSHLAQVWAQTLADYFSLNIRSFSGGTEATAVYPLVIETLVNHGFIIKKLNDTQNANSLYLLNFLKGGKSEKLFSKKYNHDYNPRKNFIAVMTCSEADENCPLVFGAKQRFALTYKDPKVFDGTELAQQKYMERSLQIATELYYVFQKFK